MTRLAALCVILLLGSVCVRAQAGDGGGTGGSANVTLFAFCNATECEAYNASQSGGGGVNGLTAAPNATVITLGECMLYQIPALDCGASATNASDANTIQQPAYGNNVTAQWLSFMASSCSNETANDTVTMWLFNQTNCTGSPSALSNVRCNTCLEWGNTTISVNCSELQSGNVTNDTTGMNSRRRQAQQQGDCPDPNSLTVEPTNTGGQASTTGTVSPATTASGGATTGATAAPLGSAPVTEAPTTATASPATTGRQQSSAESVVASGIVLSFLAIWIMA